MPKVTKFIINVDFKPAAESGEARTVIALIHQTLIKGTKNVRVLQELFRMRQVAGLVELCQEISHFNSQTKIKIAVIQPRDTWDGVEAVEFVRTKAKT